ncbi:hypothetical protein NITLEN_60047 [Nitrospira lenta]|uniref:Uncharacterized protein n=1 Tax=Nitrospira lenta TaxID=1436998 RepID=A0A330LAX2_9BACT|nr:hypothetical protein NITLEN_60047 [Nitrospira lenta]
MDGPLERAVSPTPSLTSLNMPVSLLSPDLVIFDPVAPRDFPRLLS